MTAPATAFWRVAGMTYLQVCLCEFAREKATRRQAKKPPLRRQIGGGNFRLQVADCRAGRLNGLPYACCRNGEWLPCQSMPALLLINRFSRFHFVTFQYVNRAAVSVRSALKEPTKSKLMANSSFSYKAAAWEGGVQSSKKEITTLGKAGAMP